MRLIDADSLKEDLRQYYPDEVLNGVTAKSTFNQIMHDIDNAPTVEHSKESLDYDNGFIAGCEHTRDKYLRQAHWLVRDGYPHRVYCSLCNITFCDTKWEVWKDGSLPRAYCPNCGAKMEET